MHPPPNHPAWATAPLPIYPSWLPGNRTLPSMLSTERRRWQRWPCRLIARVREQTDAGHRSWTGLLADFSDGGFALEAAVSPPIGILLEVDFYDAVGQNYARVVARVIHNGGTPAIGLMVGCEVIGPIPIP